MKVKNARKRYCRFCGDVVETGSDAFCQDNPDREKAVARWRAGDKRFKYKARTWTIGPVLVMSNRRFPK